MTSQPGMSFMVDISIRFEHRPIPMVPGDEAESTCDDHCDAGLFVGAPSPGVAGCEVGMVLDGG